MISCQTASMMRHYYRCNNGKSTPVTRPGKPVNDPFPLGVLRSRTTASRPSAAGVFHWTEAPLRMPLVPRIFLEGWCLSLNISFTKHIRTRIIHVLAVGFQKKFSLFWGQCTAGRWNTMDTNFCVDVTRYAPFSLVYTPRCPYLT